MPRYRTDPLPFTPDLALQNGAAPERLSLAELLAVRDCEERRQRQYPESGQIQLPLPEDR